MMMMMMMMMTFGSRYKTRPDPRSLYPIIQLDLLMIFSALLDTWRNMPFYDTGRVSEDSTITGRGDPFV